ncbi:hypothetical protein SK128_023676 [Halocaridina rubra]|uniref:C2H2-type domain-containing protein n=1 Tax=Halocaridina rubra TaxID=373956 RepID=A0AAN9FU21_HALRR
MAVHLCMGDVTSLVCPVCGKAFGGRNRRQILERHIATHTGLKPFTCLHCPFRSARQDTLKTHVTRMHKDIIMGHIGGDVLSSGGGGGRMEHGLLLLHLLFLVHCFQ